MIIQAYFQSALLIYLYMTSIFFVAQIKKNNSIVDVAWGIGFIIVTLFTFFYYSACAWQHITITFLIIIWGLRLSGYIGIRNWKKGEDPRYKAMRDKWKRHIFIKSFFNIFMLQGTILLIIILPVVMINTTNVFVPFSLAALCSIFIWIIGFVCENIGDYQLYRFLQNPKNSGHVMTQGIWRYTRHPNYFGEAAMWWGIWFFACATTPNAVYSIISPLLITYLLRYVSGVPLAEKPFIHNNEYKEYKKRTNAFFPWFSEKKE